jgi:hypothetical protein
MEISEEEYKEFLRLKNLKWALDLLQTEQGKKEYASQILQVENEELKAEVIRLKKEKKHLVTLNATLRDRPDLGDRAKRVQELQNQINHLKDLYCLVANCAIQIKEAQNDGLPGKVASFVEELLNHLILHTPEGDFTDTQIKLRKETWSYINNYFKDKNKD